jgi:hypothetical protein
VLWCDDVAMFNSLIVEKEVRRRALVETVIPEQLGFS